MWRRKNDVRSPKIGSPMSDNLLTTRYSACAYVKMMDPPRKLDPQCLKLFSPTIRYSACADVKIKYAPPKLDPPCLTIFYPLLDVVHLQT